MPFSVRSLLFVGALIVANACGPQDLVSDDATLESAIDLPPNNLIKNPSFEVDTSNWTAWHGSVTRVQTTAADGAFIALVTQTTGTAFALDDWPDTVTSSTAGTVYTLSASVRARTAGTSNGKPFQVVIRERTQSLAVVRESSASGTLTLSFQRLTVNATAVGTGNIVDVYVMQTQAVPGDAFYVDAVALTVTSPPASGCVVFDNYGTPAPVGTIQSSSMNEISGVRESFAHPGVLWRHNDSGDSARFFAVSTGGATVGTFNVTNASAIDWEDVSVGPCPAGSCVFIGDTGDNAVARGEYAVYRIPEPNANVGQSLGTVAVAAEKLPFIYPDGKHNAETLMVHPVTGDIYIVAKNTVNPVGVYKFPKPFTPGIRATLIKVASLTFSGGIAIMAGDIHPCSNRFMLRNYNHNYEYRAAAGASFETAFLAFPVTLPVASEPQGEAISYAHDGASLYTVSEGTNQPIYRSTGY